MIAGLRRAAILREMGLGPLWRLRQSGCRADTPTSLPSGPAGGEPLPVLPARLEQSPTPIPRPSSRPQPSPAAAPASAAVAAPATVPDLPDAGRQTRILTLDWDALEAEIRACRACVLCQRRKQVVPGVGDRRARWMLVGEGPGAEEDQRGQPFVGQAGKLLDNMLAAIGLGRDQDVYIGNAVKCRPPHNRTPELDELRACQPFLHRQIDLVRPRLLIALGRPAARALLDTEVRIGDARGRLFEHRGTPVIVTYHPAYLLRNPQDKAKAWEDLCFARRVMQNQQG